MRHSATHITNAGSHGSDVLYSSGRLASRHGSAGDAPMRHSATRTRMLVVTALMYSSGRLAKRHGLHGMDQQATLSCVTLQHFQQELAVPYSRWYHT